jgi:hypothetical protein
MFEIFLKSPNVTEGWLEFVTKASWGSPKLSSSGLVISMTNPTVHNL